MPSGPRVIGCRYSGGAYLCWRCVRKHSPDGHHADLPYLKGYCERIRTMDPGYKNDYYCDECGVLIDENC